MAPPVGRGRLAHLVARGRLGRRVQLDHRVRSVRLGPPDLPALQEQPVLQASLARRDRQGARVQPVQADHQVLRVAQGPQAPLGSRVHREIMVPPELAVHPVNRV